MCSLCFLQQRTPGKWCAHFGSSSHSLQSDTGVYLHSFAFNQMCHWLTVHKRSVQSTFDVLSDTERHFTSLQPLLICPFPDTAKSANMTKLSPRRAPSKRKAAKVARKRIAKIFKKKMSKKKMYTPHESILQALDMAGIGPIKGVEMVANPITPDFKVGFSRHWVKE